MGHESPTDFKNTHDKQALAEAIAAAEANFDNFGPVEITGLPDGFSVIKEREEHVVDRYVFSGHGIQIVLFHDRALGTIVDRISHNATTSRDEATQKIQEIEDRIAHECKSALIHYLTDTNADTR